MDLEKSIYKFFCREFHDNLPQETTSHIAREFLSVGGNLLDMIDEEGNLSRLKKNDYIAKAGNFIIAANNKATNNQHESKHTTLFLDRLMTNILYDLSLRENDELRDFFYKEYDKDLEFFQAYIGPNMMTMKLDIASITKIPEARDKYILSTINNGKHLLNQKDLIDNRRFLFLHTELIRKTSFELGRAYYMKATYISKNGELISNYRAALDNFKNAIELYKTQMRNTRISTKRYIALENELKQLTHLTAITGTKLLKNPIPFTEKKIVTNLCINVLDSLKNGNQDYNFYMDFGFIYLKRARLKINDYESQTDLEKALELYSKAKTIAINTNRQVVKEINRQMLEIYTSLSEYDSSYLSNGFEYLNIVKLTARNNSSILTNEGLLLMNAAGAESSLNKKQLMLEKSINLLEQHYKIDKTRFALNKLKLACHRMVDLPIGEQEKEKYQTILSQEYV
ncbi:MAG: hypothetical protein KKF89_05645 [Nanoarchaeota archaeon]|nr:hypothetical protein [Nanoarchaeota archaeon]MBU1855180.1 hypothetical protein [Nanoarchaeota archaeon]